MGSLLLTAIRASPSAMSQFSWQADCPPGPPSGTGERQRDLLPLPFTDLPAEGILAESSLPAHAVEARDLVAKHVACAEPWVCAIVSTLSFMYANRSVRRAMPVLGPCTLAQSKSLSRMYEAVALFLGRNAAALPEIHWADKVRTMKVNYQGEEVGHAQTLTLEQVIAGLPPVGIAASVPATHVAVGAVREALENPLQCILPAERWPTRPRRAKTWATQEVWEQLVEQLWLRGIVGPINDEDIFRVHGERLLNGCFGVVKPHDKHVQLKDGTFAPVLRLIMNFVPTNEIQHVIEGDTSELPVASQWGAIALLEHETLLWSSCDRQCFFYVWHLPESWMPFMTFERPVPGYLVGRSDLQVVRVAAKVPAMGWISAVGVTQHLARNLLRRANQLSAGLPLDAEVRRRRAFPITGRRDESAAWEAYIDNLESQEIFNAREADALRGAMSELVVEAKRCYQYWGTPGSDAKDVFRAERALALEESIDGRAGRREMPPDCVPDLIRFTAWLCLQPAPSKRLAQVCLGRWVRVLCMRRATMGVFDRAWRWLTQHTRRAAVPGNVVEELLCAASLAPLCLGDLPATIDNVVTVSDASPSGGGACASRGLMPLCADTAVRCGRPAFHVAEEELILVGAFDGIAGLREAWDRLGLPAAHYVSLEIDPPARRVARDAWPDVDEWGDIAGVSDERILALRSAAPRATRGLVGGGFPCQGLSSLNASRKGLADPRSGLLHVLLDFVQRLRKLLPAIQWDFLYENVDSAPQNEIEEVSRLIGAEPYFLDAGQICSMRRPRLYWLSRPLQEGWEEACRASKGRRCVPLTACLPDDSTWLDTGAEYVPASEAARLPTAVRRIPRRRPPERPAGLHRCDAAAKQRWAEENYATPPYQFHESYLVRDALGHWRRPNANEREVLLGFRKYHTLCAVRSSAAKHDPKGTEIIRESLLGNTFHVIVVAWLLAHLAVAWRYLPELPAISSIREAGQRLRNGPLREEESTRGFSVEQLLVLEHVRHADHKGSDVRLDTGALMSPSVWPRKSINPQLWRWAVILAFKWWAAAHINELELRTVLSTFKWRLRRASSIGSRFLHLLDSLVSLAVLCKKRSSSWRLNRVVRKVDALELAGFVLPCYGFSRSEFNPADAPSRWGERRH